MQSDHHTDAPAPPACVGGPPDEFLRTSRILPEIERLTGHRFSIEPRRLATWAAANMLPEMEQRGPQQYWGAERRHLPVISRRLVAILGPRARLSASAQIAA